MSRAESAIKLALPSFVASRVRVFFNTQSSKGSDLQIPISNIKLSIKNAIKCPATIPTTGTIRQEVEGEEAEAAEVLGGDVEAGEAAEEEIVLEEDTSMQTIALMAVIEADTLSDLDHSQAPRVALEEVFPPQLAVLCAFVPATCTALQTKMHLTQDCARSIPCR